MTDARRTIRIFFSWQSDLNPEVTTRAIRSALRAAMTDVEKDHPVDIVLDEATRNVSGSPYIPYAVADKISKADLFVGDITTVIRREGQSGKSFPNPNVTFELGIAAAELGWNRIIMLFNSALAALDDLPFDFDRHRISKFEFPADDNQHKRHADNLRKLAHAAIAQIVADDPKRPRELQEIPPEKIKRSRDIDNLRLFLDRVNTDYLEEHILDLPNYLNYSAVMMCGEVEELQGKSHFRFYDPDLGAAINGIIESLQETLKHSGHYRETSNLFRQSFGQPGDLDIFVSEDQTRVLKEINAARRQLKFHLDRLIDIVRERYVEVNITETNVTFAKMFASVRASTREDE